jgi:hypothetical protein
MNAIRRDRWASLPEMAKSNTGTCNVVGVGMIGIETCVTEGDLNAPVAHGMRDR